MSVPPSVGSGVTGAGDGSGVTGAGEGSGADRIEVIQNCQIPVIVKYQYV